LSASVAVEWGAAASNAVVAITAAALVDVVAGLGGVVTLVAVDCVSRNLPFVGI